ncbi:type I-B CRISPR-associated protein Cas8b1/Cst1 [Anoxybacillus rupiensis]|uniref:Type I-B CRISPR-associated protein Cas8b1/Cst1 n=1 Tax=Anoxybacteroides rupiense TaxID=311460 RepID=A0ABT5W2D6_9BACL|nr:type I-B CRISPR-associated protein Cas8b1/Cst1 [Anoxybacillus rupiensis]MBS2769938.1 type I-B CRISPR-associated protein Cas8b1/Cst1 [Anoxybacillus rupiensis]MDE8562690.1 type I-B CRISPR-associated protein Cas8b1/Cst1 [Anoxybacillus rupiensis]
MKVELRMGEWMINMGLVGLYRVFEYGQKQGIIHDEYKNSMVIQPWGIELDTNVLPQLPRAYFLYLLDEYSVARRESEKLDTYMEQAKKEEQFKNAVSSIKKTMEIGKKVLKYYPNKELEHILEKMKQIKKYEQFEILTDCVRSFKEVLHEPEVNEKLTFNYFKAAILQAFFGQVSFLNVSKTNLNLEGHIEEFQKSYIAPVVCDLGLERVLNQATSSEEVHTFLDQHKDYTVFKQWKRGWKKKDIAQIREDVKTKLNHCLFFHEHIAFYNFEEMVFSPIGVAKDKAFNFSWHFQDDQPKPLSSLAKMVLFFAPIGVAVYFKNEGVNEQTERRLYAGFVQTDAAFSEILQKNNHFKQLKKQKEPFNKIVSQLIQGIQKESDYVVEHLFFLEFFSEYSSKKTHLHYYHLPMYLAHYFKRYANKLDYIKPYDYREHFVQHVLRGADPIYVIYHYLRDCIKNGKSTIGPYIAVRERNRIMQFKKGVKDMTAADKRVSALFLQGKEIREAMIQSSGSDKKVTSIAYRLLNAAKAGNKKSFMDTLFRVYMSVDRPIAPIFLNALHERDLDFATVANAFISGLLAGQYKEEQEEVQA